MYIPLLLVKNITKVCIIACSKILATRQKQAAGDPPISLCSVTATGQSPEERNQCPHDSMPADLTGSTNTLGVTKISTPEEDLPRHIILDFSRVTFVDGTSTLVLKLVARDFQSIGIPLYVACCSAPVMSMLQKGEVLQEILPDKFFPSISDAVKSITKPRPTVPKEQISVAL